MAIDITIVPGGRRARVVGTCANRLRVQLALRRGDGGTNRLLVQFLAQALRIDSAQISIIATGGGPRRRVRLAHLNGQRVVLALAPAPSGQQLEA